MREVVLRVPSNAVEDVLDRLLPLVPSGVREVQRGREVELCIRGTSELPPLADVARSAGRWPHRIIEREVSDDWRERRVADYEPDVIGGRLVVRPAWAPPTGDGVIEIVLSDSAAFGAGTHPTTRACLELLLGFAPSGSFTDLGCGTGVLAIVAARLGWAPVVAVDLQPGSVDATLVNAAANGAGVQARVLDLSAEHPPVTDVFAANVPAALHVRVAASYSRPVPRLALLSGFGPDEAPMVLDAYALRGLRETARVERLGWVAVVLERD